MPTKKAPRKPGTARVAQRDELSLRLQEALSDDERDFSPVHAMNRFNAPVRLPDAMRAEVEQLLVRVMEASGSSKVAIEAGLLRNLGRCVEVRADLTPAAAMPLVDGHWDPLIFDHGGRRDLLARATR